MTSAGCPAPVTRVLVIDTNVLVAGLITQEITGPTARILDAMLTGALPYLMSPALLQEYRTVLLRPKIMTRHGLNVIEIDNLLTELVANAIWREPSNTLKMPAPEAGDAHLWLLPDAEPGSALITSDRLLLDNPPDGHHVLTVAAGVEWMNL